MDVLPLPRCPIRHTFLMVSVSTATNSSFHQLDPTHPRGRACSLSQEGYARRPGLTYKGAPGGFFKVADPLIERAL
jgi:hypothetical protein